MKPWYRSFSAWINMGIFLKWLIRKIGLSGEKSPLVVEKSGDQTVSSESQGGEDRVDCVSKDTSVVTSHVTEDNSTVNTFEPGYHEHLEILERTRCDIICRRTNEIKDVRRTTEATIRELKHSLTTLHGAALTEDHEAHACQHASSSCHIEAERLDSICTERLEERCNSLKEKIIELNEELENVMSESEKEIRKLKQQLSAARSEHGHDSRDTDNYRKILDRGRIALLDYMDPDSFIEIARQEDIFTHREIRDITEQIKTTDKVKSIIDKVRTRGPKKFQSFLTILKRSNQTQMVQLLERIGRGQDTSEVLQDLKDAACLPLGWEDIRNYLKTLYRKEFILSEIFPVLSDDVVSVDEIYVCPKMSGTVETRDGRQTRKSIENWNDMFYHEGKSIQYVILSGDPGVGKTTLCKKILSTWCKAVDEQGNAYVDIEHENIFTMMSFNFLFVVFLRDTEKGIKSIQDMIKQQLFCTKKRYHHTLESILSSKRYSSLVILDGLDEWASSADKFPIKDIDETYTVMFTSRPWKLLTVRPKRYFSPQTTYSEIALQGLSRLRCNAFLRNIENKLADIDPASQFNASAFMNEIEENSLHHFLETPLLFKLIIMLKLKTGKLERSKCTLYGQIIHLLIGYALEKCGENAFLKSNRPLPKGLQGCKNLRGFSEILASVGRFSFETLQASEMKLSFTNPDMEEYDIDTKVIGKLGVLSPKPALGFEKTIDRQLVLSFPHKSFQEFYAAIYLSQYPQEFSERTLTLGDIFAMSNVLHFLAGMDANAMRFVFEHIATVTDADDRIKNYRSLEDKHDSHKLAQNLFDLANQCLRESSNSGQTGFILMTRDIRLFHISNTGVLQSFSHSFIKSIYMDTAELTQDEIASLLTSSQQLIKVVFARVYCVQDGNEYMHEDTNIPNKRTTMRTITTTKQADQVPGRHSSGFYGQQWVGKRQKESSFLFTKCTHKKESNSSEKNPIEAHLTENREVTQLEEVATLAGDKYQNSESESRSQQENERKSTDSLFPNKKESSHSLNDSFTGIAEASSPVQVCIVADSKGIFDCVKAFPKLKVVDITNVGLTHTALWRIQMSLSIRNASLIRVFARPDPRCGCKGTETRHSLKGDIQNKSSVIEILYINGGHGLFMHVPKFGKLRELYLEDIELTHTQITDILTDSPNLYQVKINFVYCDSDIHCKCQLGESLHARNTALDANYERYQTGQKVSSVKVCMALRGSGVFNHIQMPYLEEIEIRYVKLTHSQLMRIFTDSSSLRKVALEGIDCECVIQSKSKALQDIHFPDTHSDTRLNSNVRECNIDIGKHVFFHHFKARKLEIFRCSGLQELSDIERVIRLIKSSSSLKILELMPFYQMSYPVQETLCTIKTKLLSSLLQALNNASGVQVNLEKVRLLGGNSDDVQKSLEHMKNIKIRMFKTFKLAARGWKGDFMYEQTEFVSDIFSVVFNVK